MAYRLKWQVEKQIVLLSIQKESSLEDFGAIAEEITSQYLDSCDAPVHVLMDMSRLEKFPHELVKIRALTEDFFRHPYLGSVIVVGRVNPLAGCIIDTLARTFRVDCAAAPTMMDALYVVGTTASHA